MQETASFPPSESGFGAGAALAVPALFHVTTVIGVGWRRSAERYLPLCGKYHTVLMRLRARKNRAGAPALRGNQAGSASPVYSLGAGRGRVCIRNAASGADLRTARLDGSTAWKPSNRAYAYCCALKCFAPLELNISTCLRTRGQEGGGIMSLAPYVS